MVPLGLIKTNLTSEDRQVKNMQGAQRLPVSTLPNSCQTRSIKDDLRMLSVASLGCGLASVEQR